MATDRATLNVSAREIFGSRASRRLRREGMIPGVVYGQGGDARPFQVPERELRHLLLEGHTLLDLQIDGSKAVPVVIKEEQRHPLRGEVVHLDCLEVRLDEAIESEVPVELVGEDQAPGVKEGGVLEHVTREVTVEALPTEIPEELVVDVSEMVIGDTVSLAAIEPPAGSKFMVDDPEEITIATLSPPRVEEEPEVEEEVLVGEDGEPIEPEEGEEGEAPEGEEGEAEESQEVPRVGEDEGGDKGDKGGGE